MSYHHVPLMMDVIGSSSHELQQQPECTNSLIQIEMIARLNNMGCACVEGGGSSDLPQAGIYFRRALDKANELIPFSPSQQIPLLYDEDDDNHRGLSVSKSLYVYQRGEYDEGMHAYSDPVTLHADIVSAKNAVTTIHYNLGQLYLRLNKDEDAQRSFSRALHMGQWGVNNNNSSECCHGLGKCSHGNHYNTAITTGGVRLMAVLHNVGHVQYRNGHYEDAIKTYTRALELIKGSFQKSHQCGGAQNDSSCHYLLLELSGTLNCLGVCHFHLPQPDTSKALNFYQEALAIRRAILGPTAQTKEIATMLNNIGRVHFMLAEHDKALELYNQALLMRRRLFGNDHLDVAATIFNAGQTFHHLRQFDRAMELYKEFLAIAKNHLGYHHRDVAAMLKCMAQIKHECNEVQAAKELYQEAIDVGRAALGEFHPEIASIFNKLGNLLYENGDLDNAIKVYRQGLEVERAVLDHDHPNITVTITNIAQIYKLQEKYDLALNLYREAVAIQRRTLDLDHPSISCTLSSIALIYYRTRRFSKALEVYQESLRIRRDAYGDNHVEVASTLNSVGLVLYKMDLHDFAMQSFHESLRIRRNLLGSNHRDVAVVLYNLATCCLESGEDDKAMQYYQETLRVEQAALGNCHPDVVLTMLHCGQVHQGRGELKEALEYYNQALEAELTRCVPLLNASANDNHHEAPVFASTMNHATMARILNHMGNIFLQRGQAKELVDAFANSLRQLRLAGKKESELVVSGFNFYALSKNHPESSPAA